jgi:hypothetical protein
MAVASPGRREPLRSTLALLGGFSISALGVALTLGTAYDLAGVLFIAAGAVVAALGPRVLAGMRVVRDLAGERGEPRPRGSLGARLARGDAGRRRVG